MKDTRWVGPKGTTIHIREGSRQPPRWVLLTIDRVLAKHRPQRQFISLRYVRCSRGCAHGYCYGGNMISVYEGVDRERTRYVVLHELAHALNPRVDRHGDGFHDALLAVARSEGALRLVGGCLKQKAPWRRAKAREAERQRRFAA